MAFPILEVEPGSLLGDEQLGSKPKFWFLHEERRWLFKEARPGTGEDWAEKVAAEVARLAKVPAARVELATYKGRRGCASMSLLEVDAEALVHGNELMAATMVGYDRDKRQRQSDHTVDNIIGAFRKLFPSGVTIQFDALSGFARYLVLDALVGNTDRHHENWALVMRYAGISPEQPVSAALKLAPSYDHASSLGRELDDARRSRYLAEGRILHYVSAGRGGIYLDSQDRHGVAPLDLAKYLSQRYPKYVQAALADVAAAGADTPGRYSAPGP
jgi:hypothetical protein